MSDSEQRTEFPPGVAYVEQVGWEEDEEHGRRFVARLCFPTGAPDLSAGVVWKRHVGYAAGALWMAGGTILWRLRDAN